MTTSYWASFGSLFIYIFWTVIYFTTIWEEEEVKVYAGANDDGEAIYNNEPVGNYILIRVVVPVLLLILAGILYCTVVASFAHSGEDKPESKGEDVENKSNK